MAPRPSCEIEGSHNLALPSEVLAQAREHAADVGVTIRGYVDASHKTMWHLGQVGIGQHTRIVTPEGDMPLPSLSIEPQRSISTAVVVSKQLLEQSFPYRQDRKLSLSQYVGRTLLLMNGLFELNIGSHLRLERTLRPPHHSTLVLPFAAQRHS